MYEYIQDHEAFMNAMAVSRELAGAINVHKQAIDGNRCNHCGSQWIQPTWPGGDFDDIYCVECGQYSMSREAQDQLEAELAIPYEHI